MNVRMVLGKHMRRCLKRSDAGEIFVDCFRFLVERREFSMLYNHKTHEALDTEQFKHTYSFCSDYLARALDRQDGSANAKDRTTLPSHVRGAIGREFSRLTKGGVDTRAVFPLVLGLMSAIDTHFGTVIVASTAPSHAGAYPELVPLSPSRPFLKPRGVGTPPKPPPELGITLVHLQLESYFSSLAVTPSSVEYARPKPSIYRPWRREGPLLKKITVGLASILRSVDDVHWQHDLTRFWGVSIAEPARELVKRRLRWALGTAVGAGVNCLVIPELNLDVELESELHRFWGSNVRRKSEMIMIVAGRTHREHQKDATFKNAPLVLLGEGVVPWPYWKEEPAIANFPELGERSEALGAAPGHVVAMDTPAGRVCVMICKDALMPKYLEAALALRSTLVVIPSMTSSGSVTRFEDVAKTIAAANRGTTVFCNSSVHIRSSEETGTLGFVHPGVRFSRGALPRHSVPDQGASVILAVYDAGPAYGAATAKRRGLLWEVDERLEERPA